MASSHVFVAIVDTYEEQVGVGVTASAAVASASRKAHAYLKRRGVLSDETATPELVAQYFAPRVERVKVEG